MNTSVVAQRVGAGCRWLMIVLLFSAAPRLLASQTATVLEGRVVGPAGAPVQGARIFMVRIGGDTVRRAESRADGSFLLLGVDADAYVVGVRALGLTPVNDSIVVTAGQRLQLTYRLLAGASLAPIQVQSRLSTLDINRRGVSSVISSTLAEELPIARRSPIEVTAIMPGIRMFAPDQGRAYPAAGAGQSLRLVTLYLDGISLKNIVSGDLVGIPRTGSPFPQEAITEMRLSLGGGAAEQAHGGAWSINATTARGQEQWQRSVFAQLQPLGVRARTFTQRDAGQRASPSRRLIVGGSANGAIVPRTLFYSGSVELARLGEYTEVVPRAEVWEQYRGNFEAPARNLTALQRLTWARTSSHEVDALWSLRLSDADIQAGGLSAVDAGIDQRFHIHVAQVRSRRWGERFESEWSAQLLSWVQHESPLVPGPQKTYQGIITGNSTSPFDLTELQARLVYRGARRPGGSGGQNHLVRYGAEVGRFFMNEYRPNNRDGSFNFGTDTSSLPSRATIALGLTDPTGTSDARVKYQGTTLGAWVTDEWRLHPQWLVTIGVRYDADLNILNNAFVSPWLTDSTLSRAPELRGFLADGHRRNDLNNFGPRLSVSYDPRGNSRTLVRGSYGVTYDRVGSVLVTPEARSARWRTYSFTRPGTTDVNELRRRALLVQGSPVSPTMVKTNLQAPETHSWSLGLGHRMGSDWAFNLDFTRQRTRHQFARANANPSDSTGARPLTARFGNVLLIDDFGRAAYDAVLSQLTWERSHAQVQLAYTLAWARNTAPGFDSPVGARYPMEPFSADERHRVVLSGFTALPWGLKWSGIGTVASPVPYTASDGRDLNGNNNPQDDFAFAKRSVRPENRWAFWYRSMDLRLSREFGVGAGRLAASLDVFNVFNAANVSAYGSQRADENGKLLPGFGQPAESYAPRSIQFGMRVRF